MSIIEAVDLCKVYRYHHKEPGLHGSLTNIFRRQTLERRAVDRLSFAIEAGEFVGFLGPNGAGKTTTLKMLAGLLTPSGGHAHVLGYTPAQRKPAFLRQISLVMGQKTMLTWDLPAIETLLVHKEMYRLPDHTFRHTLDQLSEMLDVRDLLRVQVRKLSLGERMKMELLAALLHRPAVLFLDEPTIGLDVVAQQRIRDFLGDLNRRHSTTILLTSHYMDDIEALCSRVIVIEHGHLRFEGALQTLVAQAQPHKILTIAFATPIDPAVLASLRDAVQVGAADDPRRLSLAVAREQVAEITSSLLRLGGVVDLNIAEPPIDDVMRDLFWDVAGERSML